MQDTLDIINNLNNLYSHTNNFEILKDFERVIDELDMYVYENWELGEIVEGPQVDRYWVTCSFMWDGDKMPDPSAGTRLIDYDCKVTYRKDYLVVPRKIKDPSDIRPGTQKGKLDKKSIWVVTIKMPISLITDIFGAYKDKYLTPDETAEMVPEPEEADELAAAEDLAGGEDGDGSLDELSAEEDITL
jgi:hypothetical protein